MFKQGDKVHVVFGTDVATVVDGKLNKKGLIELRWFTPWGTVKNWMPPKLLRKVDEQGSPQET